MVHRANDCLRFPGVLAAPEGCRTYHPKWNTTTNNGRIESGDPFKRPAADRRYLGPTTYSGTPSTTESELRVGTPTDPKEPSPMLSKHRFRILAAMVVAAAILITPQLAEAGSGTGASPGRRAGPHRPDATSASAAPAAPPSPPPPSPPPPVTTVRRPPRLRRPRRLRCLYPLRRRLPPRSRPDPGPDPDPDADPDPGTDPDPDPDPDPRSPDARSPRRRRTPW